MANPDARRAVSLAIDRDAINKGVYQGSLTPATSLISPPFGEFYTAGVCGDVQVRRGQGQGPGGQGRPHARHPPASCCTTTTAATSRWCRPGRTSWSGTSASSSTSTACPSPSSSTSGTAASSTSPGPPGRRLPDGRELPEPAAGQHVEDNDGKYNNPEVDTLINQLRAQKNDADRLKAAKEAEQIAIGQDQALVPTFYRTQYRVFDSRKWTGVSLDFFENANAGRDQPQGLRRADPTAS